MTISYQKDKIQAYEQNNEYKQEFQEQIDNWNIERRDFLNIISQNEGKITQLQSELSNVSVQNQENINKIHDILSKNFKLQNTIDKKDELITTNKKLSSLKQKSLQVKISKLRFILVACTILDQ